LKAFKLIETLMKKCSENCDNYLEKRMVYKLLALPD